MQNKSRRRRRSLIDGSVACAIERLEERIFLSLSAVGGELLVNSATSGDQRTPAIAVEGDGDFVVAWSSSTGDGSASAVFARRYTAGGTALGSQFLVNTTTLNSQGSPAIAMDSDGDFVIAWVSSDGNEEGIFGQRFNGAGVAQGTEFRVNTFTTGVQASPAVAMDSTGDFVVAWTSYGQDGSYYGVYAQRYNATGAAQGSEFRVNDLTLGSQFGPSMAMNAAGDFVVSWTGYSSAAAGYDTYARRYNAAGIAQGGGLVLNTYTTGTQENPTAAMDASGNFVVAWDSVNQDGHISGIYAKRYNASGAVQGAEFKVNTYTTNSQRVASAAMDADGNFVVAWASGRDGDGYGIYAQAYSASGVAESAEFKVNTYTTSKQFSPAVAIAPAGDAVIAWESHLQDGNGYGVFAQRYRGIPTVGAVLINGERVSPYQVPDEAISEIVVQFSENMTDFGGTTGINSVTNPANWLITRNGADISAGSSIVYGFNPVSNRYEATLTLSQSYISGNFLLKVRDTLRDMDGIQLDGNLDAVPGGNFLLPFSVQSGAALGGEFRVNTYTTGSQNGSSVAADSSGNYVVAWQNSGQDGSGDGVYAQRYNRAGVAQGGEFRVNTYTTGDQDDPSVAMNDNGFVVTWSSNGQDGAGFGVFAQRYNASGVALGTEFRVNTTTANRESQPSIAMDYDGDFVVTWQTYNNVSFVREIYAQQYNSSGVAIGGEFLVNTYTTGEQFGPAVAMDANGAFVVAWDSFGQDGNSTGVYAKRFNSAGVQQGVEFRVNSYTTNDQQQPSVGMSAAGDFVVAWRSGFQDGDSGGIFARRYSATGVAQGTEFRVNSYTTFRQDRPSVAVGDGGDFFVVWDSAIQDAPLTGGYGIYGQRYSAAGVPQGGETLINTYTLDGQVTPAVASGSKHNFVVTWNGDGATDDSGVFAQRFGLRETPVVGTLSDNPDPVVAGNSLTLNAGGTSADTSIVSSVSFYRETNNEPGLQVGALGDTLVGTDVTESGGFWSVTIPTGSLAAGTYTYWAQATDSTGLSGAPAETSNVVTAPPVPQVIASAFHYDTAPQKLQFTFDRDVSGNDPGDISVADITLIKIGGGAVPTLTMLPYGTDGTNVATFTMSTQLADGNYRATISATGVTDAGNPMAADYVLDFYMLGGDANHDRKVDARDLLILANNWFGSGKTWSQGDFNYDGLVNQIDLTVMAQHWQQSLAAPPPAAAPVPTSARPPTRSPARTPIRVMDLVQ